VQGEVGGGSATKAHKNPTPKNPKTHGPLARDGPEHRHDVAVVADDLFAPLERERDLARALRVADDHDRLVGDVGRRRAVPRVARRVVAAGLGHALRHLLRPQPARGPRQDHLPAVEHRQHQPLANGRQQRRVVGARGVGARGLLVHRKRQGHGRKAERRGSDRVPLEPAEVARARDGVLRAADELRVRLGPRADKARVERRHGVVREQLRERAVVENVLGRALERQHVLAGLDLGPARLLVLRGPAVLLLPVLLLALLPPEVLLRGLVAGLGTRRDVLLPRGVGRDVAGERECVWLLFC
jgi:hypothetical protein